MVDIQSIILFAVLIFSLAIKGFALWRSATNKQSYWFIALFVLHILLLPIANLGGLVDLVYLIKFAKKPLTLDEVRGWVQRSPSKKLKKD